MRSINKVIIIGNLTRDPEMRQTPNNQNVTTFGIATNREWVTKEAERKNSAEFHECVAWSHLAEICANYLKKGNLIYIEGYLKTRSWDTPEGVKKFKTEIVVQDMIKLEKRPQEDSEDYVPTSNEDLPETKKPAKKVPEKKEKKEEKPAEKPVEEPPAEPKEEAPAEEASAENPIDKDLGL